jgi:hypothetical protein
MIGYYDNLKAILTEEIAREIDRQILNELLSKHDYKTDLRKRKLLAGSYDRLKHITLHVNI